MKINVKKIIINTFALMSFILLASCGSTAPCGLAKTKQDSTTKEKTTAKETLVASTNTSDVNN